MTTTHDRGLTIMIGAMNKGLLTILFIIASVSVQKSFCQVKDTLKLYNGQTLICDILSAQTGTLDIDEMDLKRLSIRLYKIKVIKSDREFKIETIEKEILYGSLHPAHEDGWIEIHGKYDSITQIRITDINTIVSLEKDFFSRIRGMLTSGFSYTKSRGIGQINLDGNIQYRSKTFQFLLSAYEYISIDSTVFSRDREQLALLGGWSFSPTWFAGLGWAYQRNVELSLARRYQELIGIGNKLLRRKLELYGLAGLSFNQEKTTSGKSSGLLVEVPLLTRLNFFNFSKPNLQIGISQNFYISLSESGRYRYDAILDLSLELFKNCFFTLNPGANYDSKPTEGTSNFDFSFTIGLSYKF